MPTSASSRRPPHLSSSENLKAYYHRNRVAQQPQHGHTTTTTWFHKHDHPNHAPKPHLMLTVPPCCTVWPSTTLETPRRDASFSTSAQARLVGPCDRSRLQTAPFPPSSAPAWNRVCSQNQCHAGIKTSIEVGCASPASDAPTALGEGHDLPEQLCSPARTSAFHNWIYSPGGSLCSASLCPLGPTCSGCWSAVSPGCPGRLSNAVASTASNIHLNAPA